MNRQRALEQCSETISDILQNNKHAMGLQAFGLQANRAFSGSSQLQGR